MADCPMLAEIKRQAAGNIPLQKALVAGVVMEGGSLCGPWPRGDGGCAAGGFQIRWWLNPCDKGKVWQGHPLSPEEAEEPTIAVAYAIVALGYRSNALRYTDPVQVAFHSERPRHFYSDEQVARARAAIEEVFAMVTQPPLVWYPAHADNYTAGRPDGVYYEAWVIHTTAGGRTIADLGNWFANPQARASTPYGVDLDGSIGQFVSLQNTSYAHGGTLAQLREGTARVLRENLAVNPFTNPNEWAIGCEHLDGGVPGTVTEAQFEASARLCAWVFQSEILPFADKTGAMVDRDHIIGHWELNPVTRKFCPSWPSSRMDQYVARVQALLQGEPPAVDYRALYEAELRGCLAAAEDDGRRAAVRIEELQRKLRALTA
jgi:hypothetical protein